jgi:hypothetical protein
MSPVAADRLTCTTSVEVKMAYQRIGVMDGQLSSKVGRCEDAPGAGEREKVLFYQRPRHTHDDPRQKNPGHVAQRRRRDGGQTLLQTVGYTRGANGASETAAQR